MQLDLVRSGSVCSSSAGLVGFGLHLQQNSYCTIQERANQDSCCHSGSKYICILISVDAFDFVKNPVTNTMNLEILIKLV